METLALGEPRASVSLRLPPNQPCTQSAWLHNHALDLDGRMRTEGKVYIVQDGDVVNFLFNV